MEVAGDTSDPVKGYVLGPPDPVPSVLPIYVFACHAERSERHVASGGEMLRYAQHDKWEMESQVPPTMGCYMGKTYYD
jgi:hypothetical protein